MRNKGRGKKKSCRGIPLGIESTNPTDQRNSCSYQTKRDIMMDGGIRKIKKRRISSSKYPLCKNELKYY
jgi:hypothetical protein